MAKVKQTSKANRLAQDLTLVLLRNNGSPRAFRIRVPSLARSLLSLSGTILTLGICTLALIAVLIWHNRNFSLPRIQINRENPSIVTPAPAPTPAPEQSAATAPPSQSMDAIPAPESVLREELVKVQKELEARKQLAPGAASATIAAINTPIQLLGSTSTLLPDNEIFVQAKNLHSSRSNGVATLEFDLQNTHPTQQQVRGYIVVLAKTAQALYAYPEAALSPKDNILVNYARGETFAISRFRQASAKFTHIPADSGPIHYQAFLFTSNGKILISTHFEGK